MGKRGELRGRPRERRREGVGKEERGLMEERGKRERNKSEHALIKQHK